MSIEISSKSIPRDLLLAIVDVYRDGKNAYGSVDEIPQSWLREKFAKSDILINHAEKAEIIVYMMDDANPSLSEIAKEISKFCE